jgi:hypothetical protein
VADNRQRGLATVRARWFVPLFILACGTASADVVDTLLDRYRAEGAGPFSAAAGQELWARAFLDPKGGEPRSCARCHTSDLRAEGRHALTGKPIAPMKPAVNDERLTDASFVERWFRKSCYWTLGRVCTAQEKGDLLLYIRE